MSKNVLLSPNKNEEGLEIISNTSKAEEMQLTIKSISNLDPNILSSKNATLKQDLNKNFEYSTATTNARSDFTKLAEEFMNKNQLENAIDSKNINVFINVAQISLNNLDNLDFNNYKSNRFDDKKTASTPVSHLNTKAKTNQKQTLQELSENEKKKLNNSDIEKNNIESSIIVRKDRKGVPIVKGGRIHKVTFIDRLEEKRKLIEYQQIESYKKYNLNSLAHETDSSSNKDKSNSNTSCCLIY